MLSFNLTSTDLKTFNRRLFCLQMVRVFREHHMEVYDKVMRRFRSELGLTEEEYKQKSLLLEILEFERKHVRRIATL